MMYRADLLEMIASRASHIVEPLINKGKSIDFLDRETLPERKEGTERGGALLDWDENKATIWSSQGGALHHVFHVLLHLNRYWIHGSPQFWDQKRGCRGLLYEIESAYEHLVVIPVEIAHYPEAFSYWVNLAEEQLYSFKAADVSRGNAKARLFQLYLLSLTAFPRSQVADSIEKTAHERGLMDEFSELSDIVFKNFQQKAFVLESLCLYRLGSVPDSLGLRWLENDDADQHQFFWASLKDYQTLRELPSMPTSIIQQEGTLIQTSSTQQAVAGADTVLPVE